MMGLIKEWYQKLGEGVYVGAVGRNRAGDSNGKN